MTTKKPGRGVDRKGRSKKRGKFVALSNDLLISEAWRTLPGSAVRYYLELRRRYNGANNGGLHLSLEEAKALLHMGKSTALRARLELEDRGFIRRTRTGGFYQQTATTWALTDERAPPMSPTFDYRNWCPKKKSSVPKQDHPRSQNDTTKVIKFPPRS